MNALIMSTNTIATQQNKYSNIPQELKNMPQWCVAGPDKSPYYYNGRASSADSSTWMTFEAAYNLASEWNAGVGFILTANDPFACIDLDDKEDTTDEERTGFKAAIESFDSYTEYSRSGKGYHIWVKGVVGRGRKRQYVELYDRARFIICTGNVVRDRPVEDRFDLVKALAESMGVPKSTVSGSPVDMAASPNQQVIEWAQGHAGWTGPAWRGELPQKPDAKGQMTYYDPKVGDASQSASDLVLVKILMRKTASDDECWATFRQSALGKRDKAKRADYARGTMDLAREYIESDAKKAREADPMVASLLGIDTANPQSGPTPEPAPDSVDLSGIMQQAAKVTGSQSKRSKKRLNVVNLNNVRMKAVHWLWKGWLPVGYITLIAGESKVGKSSVVVDLASRITCGRELPGEDVGTRAPGRIMWLATEDGIEDMLKPRFVAAGANLDNLDIVRGTWSETGAEDAISLVDDLSVIEDALTDARLNRRPYDAIVVDPITGYLTSKSKRVDQNSASDLRPILQNFIAFAERNKIAVMAITHFSKGSGKKAAHRVLGSQVFVATSRSLIIIEKMKETEDYIPAVGEGVMRLQDSNLARAQEGSWRFTTQSKTVAQDEDGHPITASCVEWGEFDASITDEFMCSDQYTKPSTRLTFAKWIREYFEKYDQEWLPVSDVIREALAMPTGNLSFGSPIGQAAMPSKKWWDTNSKHFVEKKNQNGTWMCRLLQ